MIGFSVFPTALGHGGIAWGPNGIVGVQLPVETEGVARTRMRRRYPDGGEQAPPDEIQRVVEGIVGLMRGELVDLSKAPLDFEGVPTFHRQVYEIARAIPPGETVSYGEIATRLGDPGAARAVGQAMGRNPFAPVVPCHRVLAAGGKIGGFSAPGGRSTKQRLLAVESGQRSLI